MPTPGSNLPIDESVIPSAVKANASNADALQAAFIAQLNGTAPPAPQPEVPQPQPETPPAPQPQPEVPPQQIDLETILTMDPNAANEAIFGRLQHAYRSLAGRFRAARERDQQTIEQLAAELRQRAAQPAPAPFALPNDTPQEELEDLGLSQETIDGYGPELISIIDQVATKRANAARARTIAEVRPTLEQLAQNTVAQRENACIDYVNSQLPQGVNFDGVNEDPRFVAWLQLTDPMSGATRQELLDRAWSSQNGGSVAAIMKGFIAEVAPRTKDPAPAVPARQPQMSLDRLAAPGNVPRATVPAPQPEGKPIFSRKDVQAFYRARTAGFYKGREAEAEQYDRDIILAGREGRIV